MKHFPRFFSYALFGGGILFFFTGCTVHRLDIQTQYLNQESLASYHVGTPDPRLYDPVIGQRLLIQWSLHSYEIKEQGLFLYLKVRLHNHEEREVALPITSKRGMYLYELTNEDYYQSGGILTYFAEIRNSKADILASWKHPLWVELIQLDCS